MAESKRIIRTRMFFDFVSGCAQNQWDGEAQQEDKLEHLQIRRWRAMCLLRAGYAGCSFVENDMPMSMDMLIELNR